jgi:hypothetical protein
MCVARLRKRASTPSCGHGQIAGVDLQRKPVACLEPHTTPASDSKEQSFSREFVDASA